MKRILAVTGAVAVAAALAAFGVTNATAATAPAARAAALDPTVAPGGNFNLAVWSLQLPIGSPGSPTTIPPAQLKGPDGYTNPAYFWTDKNDGSMTFWAPEKGVTTPNSNYARSELREMNPNGSAADWPLAGNHTLSATLRVPQVTKNVCVGQVHLGSGGSSTKPLLELYYRPNGDIHLGTENSPAGGQTLHLVGNVPLGKTWSYVINVSGNRINLTVNGANTSYSIPSSFNPYKQYFKAGSYNQSSSESTTAGAKVKFYALTVSHS
ncbi:polysaccharide lyase family 7 protein [Couchioplanes caeruleus]|uniref:polysaccharide lyase family 7 protein n=1 Tax=Couchioplanes caeruleus TaxID=56438 RepID=UPI0020BF96AE|nr:polysaccharide lyase family 7 protein [Couchioplanes caeruleus]UQU66904.1 polysaccharide lyase family 7 protein [Couchioplanes caeruleus]